MPEYVPAGEEAYTLDLELDGYVNGFMDPDRMLTVPGCTLEHDAAYTYSMMLEAAEKDGIYLRHTDCYRSYWEQSRAYNRRCPYTTVNVYQTDLATGLRAVVGTRQSGCAPARSPRPRGSPATAGAAPSTFVTGECAGLS